MTASEITSILKPYRGNSRRPERPLLIWGASKGGRIALELAKRLGARVIGFIDSNPALHGQHIEGLPVFSPDALPDALQDRLILIASVFHREITNRLAASGRWEGRDFITFDAFRAEFAPLVDATADEHAAGAISILQRIGKIKGGSFLEIGSGPFLGVEAALILAGANFAAGVDILPIPGFPDISGSRGDYLSYFQSLLQDPLFSAISDLPAQEGFTSLLDTQGGNFRFNSRSVDFHMVSSERLPFKDGTFDAVFSAAVFEHLANPGTVIREIHRVLKLGGITFHNVDLRDHRDFNAPYEFLAIGRDEWRRIHGPHDFSCGNQLRAPELRDLFTGNGFHIEAYEPNLPNAGTKIRTLDFSRIHPDFQSFRPEDLQWTSCVISAKK